MQKFWLLMCALWLISACGQAPVTSPSPERAKITTDSAETPIATPTLVPTAIPVATITPPAVQDVANPDIKQIALDQGYAAIDAEYMARTSVATQQIDPTTWRILMTTPTGLLIDQTMSFAQGSSADIGKPIVIESTPADVSGAFAYAYTISATDAPPEILEALARAPIAHKPSRMMMIHPPLRVTVDIDAIVVYIKGFIKQYGKDTFGDFTKEYDKLVPDQALKLNDRWNMLKAGAYVYDAVWMFEKIYPYLNAIDYLQACAEKPWNPLTKKSYQDFPQDKQRIIDRLESARTEIKYEGMYMYTVIMNKVLLMGVPGLSTITKFLFGETLNSFIKETEARLKALVAEMEQMVTPCNGWRFVQKATANYPFSFEGTKCGGIDGYWTVTDDTMIEGARFVSSIEITVSEAEWIKGKKDFRWILDQTGTFPGAHSHSSLQGFTKDIVLGNKTMQYVFDNPISCRWEFSPKGGNINGCGEIMKYVKFGTPPDSFWVEDESICQAEKADMMRFGKP